MENRINGNNKIVYLTFDDGPDENTPFILDLLKKYNIKATFFNLGIQEGKHPDLVRRVVKEGHSLGNHTWFHDPELYNNPKKLIEEVSKVYEFQKKLIGKEPQKIFRFPFGSNKAGDKCIRIIEDEGFNYIDWNVYLQDGSRNPSSEKAYNFAIEGVLNCSQTPVILTHCERPEKTGPIKALEPIIKKLLEEGYSFKAIDEKDKLVHLTN